MSKTQPKPTAEAPLEVTAPPVAETVRGRALVDLLAFGLACGEFGEIPIAAATSLIAGGQFDDKAVQAA